MIQVNRKELYAIAAQHYLAGHYDKAAATYHRILKIDPNTPDALYLLGKLEFVQGRYTSALSYFDQSLAVCSKDDLRLQRASRNMRAETLRAQGHFSDAIAACKEVLDLDPDYAPALINMAAALRSLNRLDEALTCLDCVIAMNPERAETYNNRGIVLRLMGRSREAVAAFNLALSVNPRLIEARNSLANELRNLGEFEDAIESYERALVQQPDNPAILVNLFQVLSYACAWDRRAWVAGRLAKVTANQIERGALVTEPPFFCSLRDNDPTLLRDVGTAAAAAAARRAPTQRAIVRQAAVTPKPSGRLKIGYLIDGLDNQPARRKLQDLAQRHDRDRFTVFAYCTGNELNRQSHIARACDGYAALKDVDDVAAAQRIRDDGIDVLVDLSGHQPGSRLGIVAQRPAPLQVTWSNFVVSTGSKFSDYLVTDNVTVPPEQAANFNESLLYLPAGHQALGHESLPVPEAADRETLGLPRDAVVFACFGRALRFDPVLFDSWMKILDAVPGSVLWLGRTNRLTVSNLKSAVQAAGVNPDRLIFAGRSRTKTSHFGRLRCVDVWLDTHNQNSEMAMMDALWAGIPAVTLAGRTAPARGGASLLKAAGLDRLVADTPSSYVTKAIELAQQSTSRVDDALRLTEGRDSGALFDKAVVVNRFEHMLERVAGKPCHAAVLETKLPAHAGVAGAAI